jgi:hypothetical protein
LKKRNQEAKIHSQPIAKFLNKSKLGGDQQLYSHDFPKQIEFRTSLLNMIVGDSIAFSAVEQPFFRQLIQLLDPKVRIPSARTLSRDMHGKYKQVFEIIKI